MIKEDNLSKWALKIPRKYPLVPLLVGPFSRAMAAS
jgi:hypothetical protein